MSIPYNILNTDDGCFIICAYDKTTKICGGITMDNFEKVISNETIKSELMQIYDMLRTRNTLLNC